MVGERQKILIQIVEHSSRRLSRTVFSSCRNKVPDLVVVPAGTLVSGDAFSYG